MTLKTLNKDMDTPITKNADGTYTAIIYRANNERGWIMLPSTVHGPNGLKQRFQTERLFAFLDPLSISRHKLGKQEPILPEHETKLSIGLEEINRDIIRYHTSLNNTGGLVGVNLECLGAKVVAMDVEEKNNKIEQITVKIQLLGPLKNDLEAILQDCVTDLNPRCLLGAYENDARRIYIHHVIGLFFVQHK